MLDELHPKNAQALHDFARQPHHALVIELNHAIELEPLVETLCELLKTKNVIRVNDDEAVSIDSVRNIQRLAKLRKDTSEQHVFVLNAEKGISTEAQNSLLKTLEEPPTNTILVLFTLDRSKLLPTIYSRAHEISILPLELETFISRVEGSDSEIRALAAAFNQTFAVRSLEKTSPFDDVRQFLSNDHGARLKMIQSLKQRDSALDFTQRLTVLASHTLNHIAAVGKHDASAVWVSITESALEANSAITNNGSVILHLQKLALSLPHLK